jgi:hypothetical protein
MIRGVGMMGETLWPGWVSSDGKRILAAREFSPLLGRSNGHSSGSRLRRWAYLN